MAQKKIETAEVLSETEIDFYNQEDASFHITSGRDWEPSSPNAINTMPCPTIKVYQRENNLYDVLVTIPESDPIIMDWIRQEPNEENFLKKLIRGLDNGYDGIDDINDLESNNEDVKQDVKTALAEIVPMHI